MLSFNPQRRVDCLAIARPTLFSPASNRSMFLPTAQTIPEPLSGFPDLEFDLEWSRHRQGTGTGTGKARQGKA
jgi:hypothetical protein